MTDLDKTCFVIIGYGPKMDYATGRELDLDKTFEYIIKPAFEELGFLCYRASDISHSGVIDIHMYNSILKSDFVLADLSTLNANVLYELGIRHAVRKNTTILISEKEFSIPYEDMGTKPEIISTTKDITEKQVESIVYHHVVSGTKYYSNYLSYPSQDFRDVIDNSFKTAKESLQSLIQANGLDITKNYIILRKS